MAHPTLSRAPIREALVDLRTQPLADIATLEAFREAVAPELGGEVHEMLELQFRGKGTSPPEALPAKVKGFQLWSKDKLRVVHVREDGFSVSQLPPYKSWPELRTFAKDAFTRFVSIVRPERVSRCALRYINEISLPEGSVPADYLRTLPTVAPSLPQAPVGFLIRLELPMPSSRVLLTEVFDAVGQKLVLDIDTFREEEFAANDAAVWAALDSLRDVKNDVFFGCITDKAKEAFQ